MPESAALPALVDSHCHLTDQAFKEDRDEVIARARQAGVTRIVAVGGGGPIEDSEAGADLAAQHSFMRATAGIHPHDAKNYDDATEARIEALLERDEVTAVGETGLDYHYDHSPRDVQKTALARHLVLAKRTQMPIVLHCRSAETEMREVIKAERPEGLSGVVHCFTGQYEDAAWYIDQGLLVSFTGIISFKTAGDLREVASRLPLDRLMVETDSPYLAPTPHRGRRNEPSYVVRVAEVLAELHGVDLERVAEITTNNALALFFEQSCPQ